MINQLLDLGLVLCYALGQAVDRVRLLFGSLLRLGQAVLQLLNLLGELFHSDNYLWRRLDLSFLINDALG